MITAKVNLDKIQKHLEKNLLSEDFIQSVKHSPDPRIDGVKAFYSQIFEPKFKGLSVWQIREVLAVLKHYISKRLLNILKNTVKIDEHVKKYGFDEYYCEYLEELHLGILKYDKYLEELVHLDFLEEVLSVGMLDLHQESFFLSYPIGDEGEPLLGALCYMLKHNFGKDVGIDFQKNRAEAAEAELAAHEALASEFWSLFLGES